MTKTTHFTKSGPILTRLLLITAAVFLSLLFTACCFYIFTSHDRLAHWYLGLNNCFYKSQVWSTAFFTPGIKSDGNMYCLLGMALSGIGAFFCISRFKKRDKRQEKETVINYDTADLIPVAVCIIATLFFWQWGNRTAMPASDEVFSALNVAGIHPFQAISYYMLPNNHLFFNLFNNLVFHPFADKVFTGRLISLFAYNCCTIVVFFWLKNILKNRWLALLAVISLSLQFQVWGFSFQARGYEGYLLAEWVMVISLFGYVLSDNRRWLPVNVISCAIGFFCLPSFLYFFLAQWMFLLLYQLVYKSKNFLIWKCQLITLGLTYLFYLPVLCFSGLEAITSNSYVASMGGFRNKSKIAFAQWMFPYFKTYMVHLFSDLKWNNLPVSFILYFLPALLLIKRKDKAGAAFGLFYICMWITFFLVVIIMKKLPFERNLIGHYGIALAGVLLAAYYLSDWLASTGRRLWVKMVFFTGIALFFSVHFLRTNEMMLKDTLYEYDVNSYYKDKTDWLRNIPAGSTIAFSDEDFYSYYVCQQNGYKVSKCVTGKEEYYVKEAFEEIPQNGAGKYVLYRKLYGNEIWQLK